MLKTQPLSSKASLELGRWGETQGNPCRNPEWVRARQRQLAREPKFSSLRKSAPQERGGEKEGSEFGLEANGMFQGLHYRLLGK